MKSGDFLIVGAESKLFASCTELSENGKIFEIDRKPFADEYRYRLYGRIKANAETPRHFHTGVYYHSDYICIYTYLLYIQPSIVQLFALFDCAFTSFVFFFVCYLYVSLVLFSYSLYFSRKLRVIVKQREFKCE